MKKSQEENLGEIKVEERGKFAIICKFLDYYENCNLSEWRID